MGIGIGIVLLVLGLILLTGAVELPQAMADNIASETLGWILLAAGILSLVLALVLNRQRRHTSDTYVERRVDGGRTTVERDYHDTDPGLR
ncbi:MAG TPA: DUF6458 family protein [Nocardioides sp.]|uniref:DUF6458 family protein n=1 Tax=Nocardioides sp. TaxID=35761 RepID=UPI002ED94D64